MRAPERFEVAEGERRMGVWRANGARDERIRRPLVGAEDFCSGKFSGAVEPGKTPADRAVVRQGGRDRVAKAVRVEDRLDDRAIAGAAAQDAAERVLRFAFARPRVPTQQRDRGEQHAGRADAALRGAVEMKGGAKPSHDRVAVAETLDGFDGAPFDLPDAGQAGADGFAVDEHRAGAAVAGVAADLDASQSAGLAQRMAEPLERRSVDPPRLAVELERNPGCAIEHQTTPPASPRTQVSIARRTSVSAASRR